MSIFPWQFFAFICKINAAINRRNIQSALKSNNEEKQDYVYEWFWSKLCDANREQLQVGLKFFIENAFKENNKAVLEHLASVSAVMFSLIEAALKNKLDPYKYLTYVFKEAPSIDMNNEESFVRLLPWKRFQ